MSVVLGISIANLESVDWVLGQELMRYLLVAEIRSCIAVEKVCTLSLFVCGIIETPPRFCWRLAQATERAG